MGSKGLASRPVNVATGDFDSQTKLWSNNVKNGQKSKRLRPTVNGYPPCPIFNAVRPNRKWVTDLTEQPTPKGKNFGCAIK